MLHGTRATLQLFFVVMITFSCVIHGKIKSEFSQESRISLSEKLPELQLSFEDLRFLVEVMQRVKATYVDPVDNRFLIRNAIKGMIENLDDHSIFLSSDMLHELKESTSGKFAGIGIQADIRDDAIYVLYTLSDTPAEKAGIGAGDKITHLDDIAVNTLSDKQISQHMRGLPGTQIKLTLWKKNHGSPVKINVTREIISLHSVESKLLEQQYGYIRIKRFQTTTGQEVKDHVAALEKKQKLSGIILDLRDNPGGTLQTAIEVADLFISRGTIVHTRGRMAGSDMEFLASKRNIAAGLPLSVLINENSASGSEIVAGALKDHDRAIIIGSRSYGKGSVQSIIPLHTAKNAGIKLTTARYYTPSGKSIQSVGIIPDITVTEEKNALADGQKTNDLSDDRQLFKALNAVMNKKESN